MRFRILNQISKSIRSSSGGGRSSSLSEGRSTIHHKIIQAQPSISKNNSIQQRLFTNNNNIRIARTALGVEGCTSTLTLLVEGIEVEPSIPRGWDAGVDDDDGG